mmetsp:Transcript_13632/g.28870  ORF Transcript_13632/g.28870 Transcript_13632/m.28870 type:complete len:569 (+) Transcript_13632:131-1837(+)
MNANNYQGASNAWAPISYPATSIFEKFANITGVRKRDNHDGSSIGMKVGLIKTERSPNPFFPLHRDVLLATMRELLILGGIIDHRTLEVANRQNSSPPKKNMDETNQKSCVGNLMSKKQKLDSARGVDISSRKKRSSVGILVAKPSQMNYSALQPHIVPRSDEDDEKNKAFDFNEFRSSEELVIYAVKQAISEPCSDRFKSFTDHDICKEKSTSLSARKVSDVDIIFERDLKSGSDIIENEAISSNFPSHIISLVRSNILVFQTPPSNQNSNKSKEEQKCSLVPRTLTSCTPNSPLTDREKNIFSSTLTSPMTVAELLPSNTANFFKTNDSIVSFLRHPQQQNHDKNTSRFVLPKLLNASITDEINLRKVSQQMTSNMLNAFPIEYLDFPLRTFLGYKTSKAPSLDRLLELLSDIMCDVSHAMYAWVQTENEILSEMRTRKESNPNQVAIPKNANSRDNITMETTETKIKELLFDDLALKRIGGFHPSSLLPLALGIRRCRDTGTPWCEYACFIEGREAMKIHEEGNTDKLLHLGKIRKGRRGRKLKMRPAEARKKNCKLPTTTADNL